MLKTGFMKRLHRLLGLWKSRKAIAGIDAAILIAFFLALMGIAWAMGPTIINWLFGEVIGNDDNLYSLLLELPVIDDSRTSTMGQQLGVPITKVFNLMQTVALSLFAIVLIIAGVCYVMESFKIMSEGTASRIITGSVFTLILIFACKPLYNVVAEAINLFVGWQGGNVNGSGLLIEDPSVVDTLIEYALGRHIGQGNWTDPIIGFFAGVILLIITASILLLTAAMGIVRLFLAGALAALLPLILVLRLIPLTKRFADSLLETLIGLMFASIMAAIFILFGYQIITLTGWSGTAKTIAAIVTLLAGVYMPTMFAGRLGGLFMSTATMATMAISTATGIAIGTAGMAAGGLTGMGAGLLRGVSPALKAAWSARGTGGALAAAKQAFPGWKAVGKMAAQGAGLGAAVAATPILQGAVTGKLATPVGAAGTLTAGAGAMQDVSKWTADKIAKLTSGKAEEAQALQSEMAFLNSICAAPTVPEATEEAARRWWNSEYKQMTDEELLEEIFGSVHPEIAEKIENKALAGREIRKRFKALGPVGAYSALLRARMRRGLDEKQREFALMVDLANVRDNWSRFKDKVGKRGVKVEELDITPGFAGNILTTGTEAENIAMAHFLEATRKEYNPLFSAEDAKRLADETKLLEMRAEEIGGKYADLMGVPMNEDEKVYFGARIKRLAEASYKQNPILFANIAATLKNEKRIKALTSGERFTKQAVKRVADGDAQKWLANQLGIKPEELPSLAPLFEFEGKREGTVSVKSQPPSIGRGGGAPPSPPSGEGESVIEMLEKHGRMDLLELQRRMSSTAAESDEAKKRNNANRSG